MEPETWKPVLGYEGLYEVSDHGRVRGITRRDAQGRVWPARILSPGDRSRYAVVGLWRDGKQQMAKVHRLVLEAFVGPCPEGKEACHGPAGSGDNSLGNLRWDTRSENMLDQVRHGTHARASRVSCPYGHRLEAPNLVSYRLRRGHRLCLACERARAEGRRGGVPVSQGMRDAHYRTIIATCAPTAGAIR